MTPDQISKCRGILASHLRALEPEHDILQALDAVFNDGVMAERETCARLASGMSDGADCDDRGTMDPETGEVPCSAELRGEVCICVELSDLAHKIATKIRARSI